MDISETIDIKVKALQQHVSQVPVDEVEKWMKDWAKEDAKDKEFEYCRIVPGDEIFRGRSGTIDFFDWISCEILLPQSAQEKEF